MRRVTLVLALLLPVGHATAAELPPRVQHLRPLAAAVFPAADGRCGTTRIEVSPVPLEYEAAAIPADCLIRLDARALRRTHADMCALLVHEFGHIDRTTGRGPHDPRDAQDHSYRPTSIMYRGGAFAANATPCVRLALLERRLLRLQDRAVGLRDLRADSNSPRRRRRINRLLASVKVRGRATRVELGP